MNPLVQQFVNPDARYRGKPFWSWNGTLDRAELFRQIAVFKEMGLGGFFMHSRTGLVTEYLGDAWFELTNACADEAERLGMEAWLYDEDRWPSGTAGGLVTESPEYRAKFISLRTFAAAGFQWDVHALAIFACRLDGVAATAVRRLAAGDVAGLNDADTVLVFTIEEQAPSTFYNGFTYVDTLNRQATDAYLRITHEQYRVRCGDRLGTSIRGIFTDEPHRGPVMNGFSLSNENRLWMAPWTDTLFAEYRKAFGDDLADRLPELFLQVDGRVVSPVKWQYMELLQRLFLANFAKPMLDWCTQNKMTLTGHVLHEDTLTAQVCMQGSLMRFYEYMHWPGIDILGEHTKCWWAAKQLQSVARQLGQPWLLSELYGCTGWQMTFEQHKAVGDWQALFGINVRCHHLSWYTMAGEAKRDYPASISFQSAWWPYYKHVEDYFARLGLLLSRGRAVCDVLVINPVESLWCQVHAGWANSLSPTGDAVKALDAGYAELFEWMAGDQIDFDYADEEMLGRLTTIDAAAQPLLRVGRAAYRTVVVGRATTLRQTTVRLLEDFVAAGGRVILVGDPPAYVDAVADARVVALAAKATAVAWDRAAALSAIQGTGGPISVRSDVDGTPVPGVFTQLHVDEQGDEWVVLLNTDRARAKPRLKVSRNNVASGLGVAEWDLQTGERFAHASRQSDREAMAFEVDLPAGGSRAFVIGYKAAEGLAARPTAGGGTRTELAGPFRFSLTEPNVCVLDLATFRIDDGPTQPRTEVLKIDRAVRAAFGLKPRAGEMVQPWYRQRTEPTPPPRGRVQMSFAFDIETLPTTPVTLAMETPERFAVTLNDRPIDTAAADGWWVDPAFRRLPIRSDALRVGPNVLTLEVMFDEGVNLEAVYLLGNFGVTLDNAAATLTALPATLRPGDVTSQGLPFYGAGIHYRLPVPASSAGLTLDVTGMEAACAVVHAPTGPRVIAWQPLVADVTDAVTDGAVALEVVLTRRNTFGPLHQVPLRTTHYGPDNFVTTGERWSDAYMFYPAGLLRPPAWVTPIP